MSQGIQYCLRLRHSLQRSHCLWALPFLTFPPPPCLFRHHQRPAQILTHLKEGVAKRRGRVELVELGAPYGVQHLDVREVHVPRKHHHAPRGLRNSVDQVGLRRRVAVPVVEAFALDSVLSTIHHAITVTVTVSVAGWIRPPWYAPGSAPPWVRRRDAGCELQQVPP